MGKHDENIEKRALESYRNIDVPKRFILLIHSFVVGVYSLNSMIFRQKKLKKAKKGPKTPTTNE